MSYPTDPTPNYGAPPPPPATTYGPPPQMPQVYVPPQWAQATPTLNYQITDRVEKGVSQLALMSMIAGIAAFPFMCSSPVTENWPIMPALLGIAAAALGHVSLAQPMRPGYSRGSGLAITGLILGYLMVAISIVWVMLKIRYSNGN
jgi:hypothetical protein